MTGSSEFIINEPFYQWCVRGFSLLRKRLGINIEVHAEDGLIESGQIFLFNHFARFETIIPQYFIYKATRAYCRCVATHELFDGSDRFAKLLWGVGAVPNNHPGLLGFLAAEILRGRKVIIFPEGSMVKDRHIATAPASIRSCELLPDTATERLYWPLFWKFSRNVSCPFMRQVTCSGLVVGWQPLGSMIRKRLSRRRASPPILYPPTLRSILSAQAEIFCTRQLNSFLSTLDNRQKRNC
jgi:hypothetical protein